MTISHIKLPLRHVPPIFYKSLYVVLKENRRGICSARVVPMAKICAIGSPPNGDILFSGCTSFRDSDFISAQYENLTKFSICIAIDKI